MMSFAAKLKRKLESLTNFEKNMRKLVKDSGMECAVGYPVNESGLGSPHYENGASIIQVAIWNNYGVNGNPGRPFMDLASKNIQKMYFAKMEKLAPALKRGNADLRNTLGKLGLDAVTEVQHAIMDGNWAPNSPATIAKKESSRPLVASHDMHNRATFVIRTARGR